MEWGRQCCRHWRVPTPAGWRSRSTNGCRRPRTEAEDEQGEPILFDPRPASAGAQLPASYCGRRTAKRKIWKCTFYLVKTSNFSAEGVDTPRTSSNPPTTGYFRVVTSPGGIPPRETPPATGHLRVATSPGGSPPRETLRARGAALGPSSPAPETGALVGDSYGWRAWAGCPRELCVSGPRRWKGVIHHPARCPEPLDLGGDLIKRLRVYTCVRTNMGPPIHTLRQKRECTSVCAPTRAHPLRSHSGSSN